MTKARVGQIKKIGRVGQVRRAGYKSELPEMVAQTREEWLPYAERCHQAGREVFENTNIRQTSMLSSDPRVIATLLLIRTLSNFKGVITLARFKMAVEARILTRCCFENLFTVVMLQKRGTKVR
jgi:hypothetical protein